MKTRHNADSTNTGDVTYGHNVLLSIVRLAAQEISGVESVNGRGVRLYVRNDVVDADVYIEVNSEVSCSDIAYKVQDNIKKTVETMTDYKMDVINVNIISVKFTKH
ncbi:MAG: Asp23/Gls24 family envelope stress response protein [Clostridiales bacterium]|nr:Asp23/Gls24 family envelope stress response protein [Clostridiales bacterium]